MTAIKTYFWITVLSGFCALTACAETQLQDRSNTIDLSDLAHHYEPFRSQDCSWKRGDIRFPESMAGVATIEHTDCGEDKPAIRFHAEFNGDRVEIIGTSFITMPNSNNPIKYDPTWVTLHELNDRSPDEFFQARLPATQTRKLPCKIARIFPDVWAIQHTDLREEIEFEDYSKLVIDGAKQDAEAWRVKRRQISRHNKLCGRELDYWFIVRGGTIIQAFAPYEYMVVDPSSLQYGVSG